MRAMRARGHDVHCLEPRGDVAAILAAITMKRPRIVFNMLEDFHGLAEFEAHVAALLELRTVPHTGCNPRGLAIARDKALTKAILARGGIPVPAFVVFPRGRRVRATRLPYPLIVKSLVEESSTGLSRASLVRNARALRDRVAFVHEQVGSDAIVEEYVDGRELSVALLGNRRPQAFPPRETFLPPGAPRFVTARAKWDLPYRKRHRIRSGPARLDPRTAARVVRVGRRAYELLGLSGYARVDLRLRADGTPFVLEANPNPDLSRDDDFARAAAAAGLAYPDLVERILRLGIAYAAWYL